jgi:hypothetical protein
VEVGEVERRRQAVDVQRKPSRLAHDLVELTFETMDLGAEVGRSRDTQLGP